jgi:hypothetical protein
MGRACSANWGNRTAYRILVGNPEGEREGPLRRPGGKWMDNIKIGYVEIGWEGVDSGLVWFRIWTSGEL